MDLLGVVDGTTTLLSGNRAETTEHRFLDWTLNGKPLRSMLGWENPERLHLHGFGLGSGRWAGLAREYEV